LFCAICFTGIISLSGCGNLETGNISVSIKGAKMMGIPEVIAQIVKMK